MRMLTLVVCLVCTFCWAPGARSQEELDTTDPINIEADRMETTQEDGAILFSGNVKANQGSLIINADELAVLYTKSLTKPDKTAGTEATMARKIEKITAKGNVKIVQDPWVASGDAMDFNADDRIVIIAGNAKAWQGQNMVSGEKIILYLDEGKSVVERSSSEGERVKAFIFPSSQKKTDSKNN